MVTRIVLFDPAHCEGAKAHASQARYQHMLDEPGSFRELWPNTYSAFDGNGLVAIGASMFAEGTLSGWLLFTNRIEPRHFTAIHRVVARFFILCEQENILVFAQVDPDNPQAVRWAGLLELETRHTDILPDGRRMLRVENHVH